MLKSEEKLERISATIPTSIVKKFKDLSYKERRSFSAQLRLAMEKAIEVSEKSSS